MNEYICPKCGERSFSAVSFENLINKKCEKCGALIIAAEQEKTTGSTPKIKLSTLLSVLLPDTLISIIQYRGPYKYEAVFDGAARETYSNGVLEEHRESVVLAVTPELDSTKTPTIPFLAVKIVSRRPRK